MDIHKSRARKPRTYITARGHYRMTLKLERFFSDNFSLTTIADYNPNTGHVGCYVSRSTLLR